MQKLHYTIPLRFFFGFSPKKFHFPDFQAFSKPSGGQRTVPGQVLILTKSRENSSVPTVYNRKAQLAILDEVAGKSDGEKPIEIDLTDSVKEYNFNILKEQNCFRYVQAIPEGWKYPNCPLNLVGLTKIGHQYRYELAVELENEHLKWEHNELVRKHVEVAEEANRIAQNALAESKKANARSWWANGWSMLAVLTAVCALLFSFCR